MKSQEEKPIEGALEAPFSYREALPGILQDLSLWFAKEGRELPWRAHPQGKRADPYYVLVSEIMLQQTRIETVKPYFKRFIKTFPTAGDLAKAGEEEVLKQWEGLGYYSRAKNLHKAAQRIDQRGSFPDTYEEILALPGVGEYTAGAISSIAFGLKEPAVDGNVMRILSRILLIKENVLDAGVRKKTRELLKEAYLTVDDPAKVTEGLMELGETVCLPQNPACQQCPVRQKCLAFVYGMTQQLPVRVKARKRKIENRLVLLSFDAKGRLLTAKREHDQVLADLWEMPNVLIPEDSESDSEGKEDLQKAIGLLEEEYGITIDGGPAKWSRARHVFSHMAWNMTVMEASADITGDKGRKKETDWRYPDRIMLPTAFKKLLAQNKTPGDPPDKDL